MEHIIKMQFMLMLDIIAIINIKRKRQRCTNERDECIKRSA